MKRTLFSALVATAALSSTALASTDMNSQYFYQAPGMTHVLTPSLSYQMANVKNKNWGGGGSNPEASTSGMQFGLGYEYGLNEDMAFGANFNVSGSATGDTSPANAGTSLARQGQGLSDLGLKFQGRVPMVGPGNLVYGARANLNLQKPTSAEVGGGRNNSIPGYHHLTPYVGYEMMLGSGLLGAKLDYELIRTDRKLEYTDSRGASFDVKNKAGARWAWGLFYEMPSDDWMVGAALDFATTNDSKRMTTRNRTGAVGVETVDPSSVDMIARIYGTYMIDKDITLLPSVSYTSLMSKYREGAEMESDTDLSIGVAGRFTF